MHAVGLGAHGASASAMKGRERGASPDSRDAPVGVLDELELRGGRPEDEDLARASSPSHLGELHPTPWRKCVPPAPCSDQAGSAAVPLAQRVLFAFATTTRSFECCDSDLLPCFHPCPHAQTGL